MSTEPSPTPDGRETPAAGGRHPRPRRKRLPVVAVAAAVLLAGGGGAYWASTAADGNGPAGPGISADPPPLALDGFAAQQAAAGDAGTSDDGTAHGKSPVAPGEPGGAPPLRATGDLPDGPDAAAVHRPGGELRTSRVAALAKALNIPGKPEKQGDYWTAGRSGERNGGALTVAGTEAGSGWTYRPGTQHDGAGGGSGDGAPVTAEAAKKAVRPTLEALGTADAGLDAGRTAGNARQVTVSPQIGGLPTHAWGSSFSVGPDGEITHAHGKIGKPVKDATYPVMSAEETLKQLNKQRAMPRPEVRCMSGTASDRAPGDAADRRPTTQDGAVAPDTPCGPSVPPGERHARVTSAEFGLSAQQSRGEPVLVPSWIFDVRLPGQDGAAQVAHPAVPPEHLAPGNDGSDGDGGPARDSKEPGGNTGGDGSGHGTEDGAGAQSVDSYEAEGRTLKLTFWAGVCDTYEATATESAKFVEVRVRAEHPDKDRICVKTAKRQTVEVRLDEPLGDRKVIDARTGEALPEAG